MDEARALFPGSPEPGVHPPRLEIPAIGARTDLAVTALARQPDFKVIGLARRKTHVAGAEQHPPIMQAQPVEDRLGAGGHSLMLGVRLVGGGDRHHFDLFKLVLANETARITPSRARLGAETRRQRRHAQGQGAFIQYLFAGDRKEHTSELQSLMRTSYAVFCLKKQNTTINI